MLSLVRLVDDLVEEFLGAAELCFMVGVGAVVSEVISCSVCRIDHMGSFEEVCVIGVMGLSPDVLAVEWVEVELQPGLRPFPNDFALCVVLHRVFLVLATQHAVASFVGVESSAGAPPPVNGVPYRETHSRGQVFENVCQVVLAPLSKDPRPTGEIPVLEFFPDVAVHVVCGAAT